MLGVTFVDNQDNIFHHKKSFLQDSSEIIIVNIAEHEKRQQILDIGPQWRFISFVESIFIKQQLNLMASRLHILRAFSAHGQKETYRKAFKAGLNFTGFLPFLKEALILFSKVVFQE